MRIKISLHGLGIKVAARDLLALRGPLRRAENAIRNGDGYFHGSSITAHPEIATGD
jgi:hypothetical protein